MSVLIDSSVWIDYFRAAEDLDVVDFPIEENLVATNDLVLAELTPALQIQKQSRLIALLRQVKR